MNNNKKKDEQNVDFFLLDSNLSSIINKNNSDNSDNDNDNDSDNGINNISSKESKKNVVVDLVPYPYRIKVPTLVLESRKITWHGYPFIEVLNALRESLCDNITDIAIIHMTELVASGYLFELWDVMWEVLFSQGLLLVDPALSFYFLKEYKFLLSYQKKARENLINSQVYRNHMAELLTIFAIYKHKPQPLDIVNINANGAEYVTETITDNGSRVLSQEYILMSKLEETTCIQLQELHYNLTKLIEAIRLYSNDKNNDNNNNNNNNNHDKNNDNDNDNDNDDNDDGNVNMERVFFWLHEMVKMKDIKLRSTLQNCLPRLQDEWINHPSNIIWNYLFIRAPNKMWGLLTALMDIYTINFKRKKTINCAIILQNVLVMVYNTKFIESFNAKKQYIRSRHSLVIQNVIKINELMMIV